MSGTRSQEFYRARHTSLPPPRRGGKFAKEIYGGRAGSLDARIIESNVRKLRRMVEGKEGGRGERNVSER